MTPLRFRMQNRVGNIATIGEAFLHEDKLVFLRSTSQDVEFRTAGNAPCGLPPSLLDKLEELGVTRVFHHHTKANRLLETTLAIYRREGQSVNIRPDIFGMRVYLPKVHWKDVPLETIDTDNKEDTTEVWVEEGK